MIILGVDPGTLVSGFGILKKEKGKTFLLECGFLKFSSRKPLTERVALFHHHMDEKIKTWNVTHLALETPFLGRNAQNFLKLGYLRGILYMLSHYHKLTLYEFAPREIKQAITGYGGASKEQVARVLLQLFPGLKMPKKLDVTDALAVTICGLWKSRDIISQA